MYEQLGDEDARLYALQLLLQHDMELMPGIAQHYAAFFQGSRAGPHHRTKTRTPATLATNCCETSKKHTKSSSPATPHSDASYKADTNSKSCTKEPSKQASPHPAPPNENDRIHRTLRKHATTRLRRLLHTPTHRTRKINRHLTLEGLLDSSRERPEVDTGPESPNANNRRGWNSIALFEQWREATEEDPRNPGNDRYKNQNDELWVYGINNKSTNKAQQEETDKTPTNAGEKQAPNTKSCTTESTYPATPE